MPGPPPDAPLIESIARGDEGALADFIDRHAAWMLAVARRYTPDEPTAEDAVQDALLHLIDRAPHLVVADSIRPWLYPVVRHRAQSHARAARHADTPIPPDPPGSDRHAPELDDEIRRAVASLSEPLRETLILRIIDGLTVAQTALALQIPEGTVKSRLAAALAALRENPHLRDIF